MTFEGKRLVIFGCGYIGSALARVMTAAGARVTALTRNPAKAAALREMGLATIVAELSSTDWHAQMATDQDWVVNCVSSGGGGMEDYRRSYVGGMQSILTWLEQSGQPAGTFVYTSSTSVYPQGGGAIVDETATTAVVSPIVGALLEAENMLRAASSAGCTRWFILRLAGIYGPGRHYLLDQLRGGTETLVGSDSHRMNLTHRDDIVSAILACLVAPAAVANEIFNVTDSLPARKAEVVDWLARELGRSVPRFSNEATGNARRGGEPVPDRVISSEKIRATMHWAPRYRDFRAGYTAILRGAG